MSCCVFSRSSGWRYCQIIIMQLLETITQINFSSLFLRWMNGIFRKGFKRPLENGDVYKTLPQDETKGLADRLERCVQQLLVCLYDNVLILVVKFFNALVLPFHWLRAHYMMKKKDCLQIIVSTHTHHNICSDLATNTILVLYNYCVCFFEIL